MDRKIRPLIFLVSDREFHALQEAVEKFELSRSEVLRRALRVGLPLLQIHQLNPLHMPYSMSWTP